MLGILLYQHNPVLSPESLTKLIGGHQATYAATQDYNGLSCHCSPPK